MKNVLDTVKKHWWVVPAVVAVLLAVKHLL
jgi:hypothetical protein